MEISEEDKKCRLCGFADVENDYIFHTRDRYLVKKIAAVYSIWVTRTDPLPKSICQRCYGKVISTYKNYTQIKKQQTKWLENVAAHDPENSYVQVLNFIERANISIKNFIETNYGDKLCKDVIESLLISALSEIHENTAGNVEARKQTSSGANLMINATDETLEISPFKVENSTSDAEEDDEDLLLAKLATHRKRSPTPRRDEQPTKVKCRCCPLKFESLKLLAEHQISHLQLNIPKLFQPKCLDKNFRRGRLISVQSRQSIRCLNCYLVFDDNKCILEHWSKAECDFFCQICGEEFAQSPKFLRNHVSKVHGISYRSLKMQRDLSFLSTTSFPAMLGSKAKRRIASKSKVHNKKRAVLPKIDFNQPTNMEVSSSTTPLVRSTERPIKCRICNRNFRNFKACNSHMRAHKPPYAYNDSEQLPDLNTDAYMEPEPPSCDITPTAPKRIMPKNNSPQTTTSVASVSSANAGLNGKTTPLVTTTATPHEKEINRNNSLLKQIELTEPIDMELETIQVSSNTNIVANIPSTSPTTSKVSRSTAPRGIRMKFVNRRSDLNGGNPAFKVKSLNDLKGFQSSIQTGQTPPPLQTSSPLRDNEPSQNLTNCPRQQLFLNEIKQIQTSNKKPSQTMPYCPPPLIIPNEIRPNRICAEDIKSTCPPPAQKSFCELRPIQSISTCPRPPQTSYSNHKIIQNVTTCSPQHTSVIVNSLQNQPMSSYITFEPLQPPMLQNTLISAPIKDEPIEFI